MKDGVGFQEACGMRVSKDKVCNTYTDLLGLES